MFFYRISGKVSDLKVSKNCEYILFTADQSNFLAVGGVAAAAIGESLGSTVLTGASANAEIEIEFFICTVDGEMISGKFYKVEFEEGQYIDFAVRAQFEQREVYAARDPVQRLVWTLPYRTKGHLAQRESNFVGGFLTSLAFAAVTSVAILFADHEPGHSPLRLAGYGAFLGFFIMLIVSYRVCRKVFRTSSEATEAFKALGFADPAHLNLPKGHRKAEKSYALKLGEKEIDQKPWCFRYSDADLDSFTDRTPLCSLPPTLPGFPPGG